MSSLKEDFLSLGFFPKEVPPIFDLSTFASFASGQLPGLPTEPHKMPWAECVSHSYSKYASIRRRLQIPHPVYYAHLATEIADGWSELEEVWSKSDLSKSKPVLSRKVAAEGPRRAVEGEHSFRDVPVWRTVARSTGRYVLRADVSSFYPSVYTHAIPWAIHDKAVAKEKTKDRSLLGNRMDTWLRNASHGQTVGIPVGPDASFVVAETIMCAVDVRLRKKLRNARGFRFIDDYELTFSTLHDAEHARACLQESLAHFELELSPHKTTILELPAELDTQWVRELSEFYFDESHRALRLQLTWFFTRAFSMIRKQPGEPVLKYAVGRVQPLCRRQVVKDEPRIAKLLCSLLLQCAVADSGTLRPVLSALKAIPRDSLDLDEVKRALDVIVCRHAPLGHGSEVAWAIVAAKTFDLKLSGAAASHVAKMSDDIAVLTALVCRSQFEVKLEFDHWKSLVATPKSLLGPHWLLAYEWHTFDCLPDIADPARGEYGFDQMREAGVSFVDLEKYYEIPDDVFSEDYDALAARRHSSAQTGGWGAGKSSTGWATRSGGGGGWGGDRPWLGAGVLGVGDGEVEE